jgi:hypothetical protein
MKIYNWIYTDLKAFERPGVIVFSMPQSVNGCLGVPTRIQSTLVDSEMLLYLPSSFLTAVAGAGDEGFL